MSDQEQPRSNVHPEYPKLKKRAAKVGLLPEMELRIAEIRGGRNKSRFEDCWGIICREFGPRVVELEQQRREELESAEAVRSGKLRVLSERVPLDRVASLREIAQWVGNHLDVEPERIELAKVPSRYALAMLATAGESKASREDFIYNKYPAMVRGKEAGESGAKGEVAREEDGDPARTLIEDLLEAAQPGAA